MGLSMSAKVSLYEYFPIEAVTRRSFTQAEFESKKKCEEFLNQALVFFEKNTGAIDIVRNGKSELMYYPLLPCMQSLQEQQKTEWLLQIPVGKPRAKLDYITKKAPDFVQQLKNEHLFAKTFRIYPVFGALAKQIPLWNTLAFYLVLYICIQYSQ